MPRPSPGRRAAAARRTAGRRRVSRAGPSGRRCRSRRSAVGAERDGLDPAVVRQGRPQRARRSPAFQSRAILSPLPVNDGIALGAEGHGLDPLRVAQGRPIGGPVAASQSRAVLSKLPVKTVRPSGLKAIASTVPSWRSGGPIGSPVAAFQSRAVRSSLAGQDRFAVRAEQHGPDEALVRERPAGRLGRPRGSAPSCRTPRSGSSGRRG